MILFLFVLEKENSDQGNDLHVVSISFLIFTKHVSLPFFFFFFFFPLMYIQMLKPTLFLSPSLCQLEYFEGI